MIININPDWRIESDPLQWIVQKRRIVKGQDRWTNLSYHRSLDNAVLRLAQKRIWLMDGEYGPDTVSRPLRYQLPEPGPPIVIPFCRNHLET